MRISVKARDHLAQPNVGFMFRNHLGIDFAGTNTTREGHPLPPMIPGDIYTVDFHVQLPVLYPASFSFSPAIADGDLVSYRMCDWIDNALVLEMARSRESVYGFLHFDAWVELNGRLAAAGQPNGAAR
ncbi:MAG: Wzt carbohydrate-binding domain-containing protein [Bryobacteraceae bacterium]|nr:Wzt carbohydrate-binding domain-containing protein [Bryobacteraceae bacterium]